MKLSSIFLAVFGVFCHHILVEAVEYHLMYTRMPSGAQVTAFSGNMTIPPHISPSVSYLWPGLQSNNGVFQTVLDGRTGGWWVGTGWYGNPSAPWGGSFNINVGESLHFNYTRNSTGWTTSLIGPNGNSVTGFFKGLRRLSKYLFLVYI